MTKTPEHIRPADYSIRTPLYTVMGKDTVLRRPLDISELSKTEIERDRQFAKLLMRLDEGYGIQSPGMAIYKDGTTAFIEGRWVEGRNVSDQAAEIPASAVKHAIESVIDYYRQATLRGGPYLTDLRPSNMIYGRTAEDTEDHLYFIDLEPLWANGGPGVPISPVHMDRILPELWLLIQEGVRNGQDWGDLSSALTDLESLQK